MTLWCEGRKKKLNKKWSDSSGSDEESHLAKKRKKGSEEKMDRVDLREKQGSTYSNLQYRVWAETIVGGRHVSLQEAKDLS